MNPVSKCVFDIFVDSGEAVKLSDRPARWENDDVSFQLWCKISPWVPPEALWREVIWRFCAA